MVGVERCLDLLSTDALTVDRTVSSCLSFSANEVSARLAQLDLGVCVLEHDLGSCLLLLLFHSASSLADASGIYPHTTEEDAEPDTGPHEDLFINIEWWHHHHHSPHPIAL